MKFIQKDKFTIMGRSGCGKSHLGQKFADMFPRLIIFDTVNEYHTTEHDNVISSLDDLERFIRYVDTHEIHRFKVYVKFSIETQEKEMIFDHMMRVLYYWGNCMVVVEEVHEYCTPHFIGKYFKYCMTSGRHRNLGFIFTTQRPALINKTIMSQSTHIFVGNLIDRNDAKTVANFIGKDSKDLSELEDCIFFWFSTKKKIKLEKINTRQNNFKS
jgi:ABC-type dipeptide/oligopeptide/nickel transport system ATPase component